MLLDELFSVAPCETSHIRNERRYQNRVTRECCYFSRQPVQIMLCLEKDNLKFPHKAPASCHYSQDLF